MLVVLAGAIGLIIAVAIGVFATPLGTRLGLLDFPDDAGGRKQHARITPLVGGLALTLVVIAAIGVTVAAGAGGPGVERHLIWLGVAVAAMFGIGVADDRFELGITIRLVVATVVLFLVIVFAPDFGLAFVRFSPSSGLWLLGWLSLPFTLLCLIGLLNAVNMADGKNGIVVSLGLIWAAVLLLRLPAAMLPVMVAAGAALVVLWRFNMANALFLGDGGSYALSALFGLLAIYAYNHAFASIGADDIVLLFAVPVLDTIRLAVTRKLSGRSPFAGGRDHLHHYLYARLGWPRGLYVYVALAAVPNLAAVVLPGTALFWLVVTALAYALVLRSAIHPVAVAAE